MVNAFRLCNIINSLYSQVAGSWKLVHGCGELCRPEPKASARGDIIRHSREQVSKSPATRPYN